VKKLKILLGILFLLFLFSFVKTSYAQGVDCTYASTFRPRGYSTTANPQYGIANMFEKIRVFNGPDDLCTRCKWYIAKADNTTEVIDGGSAINYRWGSPGDYEVRVFSDDGNNLFCTNKLVMKIYHLGWSNESYSFQREETKEITKRPLSGEIGFYSSGFSITFLKPGNNEVSVSIIDEYGNTGYRFDSGFIPRGYPRGYFSFPIPLWDKDKTTYEYNIYVSRKEGSNVAIDVRVSESIELYYRDSDPYYRIRIPPTEIIPTPPPTTIKLPPKPPTSQGKPESFLKRISPGLNRVKSYKKK